MIGVGRPEDKRISFRHTACIGLQLPFLPLAIDNVRWSEAHSSTLSIS